jgi:2-polyprenyl-6-methoxyphenol hydroxylase-like FAD-dependent oxidoreductase
VNKTVLISGASIAGPALAYWLRQYGFEPTVVELAPALRGGGQAVDFRGETHFTVLERMGVLPELRRIQTEGGPVRFVDEHGRTLLRMPSDVTGGDLEVLRGDLARVLHEHSLPGTEYIFGDSITGLTETATGVRAEFRHAAPREFGLVIGADGLHSQVRRLAFGPEESYVSHLGHYFAIWPLPDNDLTNDLGLTRGSLAYNKPGRFAGIAADPRDAGRDLAMLLFASPRLEYDRHDLGQQKKLLNEAFSGLGWQVPRLLGSLRDAPELYFDSISRADVPTWSKGRIALVGDAACGATVGGMGTGCALVGAYVLAGELALAEGDHRAAFGRYERRLRGYTRGCQKGGDRVGRFLAPGTRAGLRLRNALLSRPLVMNAMIRLGKRISSTVELPDYAAGSAGSAGAARTGQRARR